MLKTNENYNCLFSCALFFLSCFYYYFVYILSKKKKTHECKNHYERKKIQKYLFKKSIERLVDYYCILTFITKILMKTKITSLFSFNFISAILYTFNSLVLFIKSHYSLTNFSSLTHFFTRTHVHTLTRLLNTHSHTLFHVQRSWSSFLQKKKNIHHSNTTSASSNGKRKKNTDWRL